MKNQPMRSSQADKISFIMSLGRALVMAGFSGAVLMIAFFLDMGGEFHVSGVLCGVLWGTIVSILFMISYRLFGKQSGWKAAAILFVVGLIAGLLVSLLSPGNIDPVISSLVGGFVFPFALLADSGFSFRKYGKN